MSENPRMRCKYNDILVTYGPHIYTGPMKLQWNWRLVWEHGCCSKVIAQALAKASADGYVGVNKPTILPIAWRS